MVATIKTNITELDDVLQRIKNFIKNDESIEITISMSNKNKLFFEKLDKSIDEIKQNKGISFSIEEFITHSNMLINEKK